MHPLSQTLALAALAAVAVASPVADPAVTQPPSLAKRATCTFSGSNGASQASASQKACATIVLSNVDVPAGQTLDLTSLNDGTTVIFEGNTTWGYQEWLGPLVSIAGNFITVQGASGAILNGNGSRWWDGKGDKGKVKPKFFAAHNLQSSSINNVYLKNTPHQAVSINSCTNLTVTGMTVDDKDGDTQGGHNTDGFDIGSSTGVVIDGAQVYNQDDCVAVNSGTNIIFKNGLCSGGHGLSIGSVGGGNTVDTVRFQDSQVINSDNGIRVKAKANQTGAIKSVTYSNITISGIANYGILIEQNYNNGDLHGQPTAGVPITNLTIQQINGQGGVKSGGTNIAIVCANCSNWTWSGVTVTGGKDYGSCQGVPAPATCKTS
ncbi:uncharacterized protein E0L32_009415 [Thyridium curvatum]|uniref:endo-polygalacturonase n=1 Tax=Thyridium curvatum TaxID=1093900 RepID=A0A507AWS1_9PEZI|nr:uncharacterized protein E0L32_009415 [Thyridium curvatum]TPX09371.1 hypothetical protein E0L32_009415 [Thyridium curvatum]